MPRAKSRGGLVSRWQRLRTTMGFMASHLEGDLSLPELARRAGLSVYHWHRLFVAVAAETPKQFALRLRLNRAATLLLADPRRPVRGIARACGFINHEVFSRAFHRRFGMAPRTYRHSFSGAVSSQQAAAHARWLRQSDPCTRLFHRPAHPRLPIQAEETASMSYSIATQELEPQPVLLVRRRLPRAELARGLGEMFGQVVAHAQSSGAALAGQPFARYVEMGPGMLTIEAGLPVAAPARGAGEVRADTLPGGTMAVTTHRGPYERLPDAHAALEVWIESHGFRSAGARWELYVTDPAEQPDPKDWRTEVFWPVERA